ncbi:MAG: RNA-guided endonuclease InsQ/TnpB family protein [Dissulfurispiraceae bacterium]
MLIRKGFKYRLKPDRFEEMNMSKTAGCNRFVWNTMLAIQKERLDNDQSCLSYSKMAAVLIEMKAEFEFLKEVHSQTLQQTLKDLDRAIKDAFDKKSPKKFPRFRKKWINEHFRYPQGFKLNDNVVYLPKVGWLPYFKSRDVEGTPKNVTISRNGKHWAVSIQTEIEIATPEHPSVRSVGIDMGIKRFATLSDGTFHEPLNSFRKLEARLALAQRKLSKKRLYSQNWHKQKAVVSRIHANIANARKDYLHKVSTTISENQAMVVLEDLQVVNMSASAKGTVEQPGTEVKQKSGLNKAILDQGWAQFRRMLEYKQVWRGGLTLAVPPQHTSQKCPVCGFVHADNRKSQAVFRCINCGYTANADHVAAINILAAGHAVLACGECGSKSASVKREPTRDSMQELNEPAAAVSPGNHCPLGR